MLLPLSGRPPVMITNIKGYTDSEMKLWNVGRNLRFILTHSVTRRNSVPPGILNFRIITHVHCHVLVLTTFSFRDVLARNSSVEIGVGVERVKNGCILKSAHSTFNRFARFTFGFYGRHTG